LGKERLACPRIKIMSLSNLKKSKFGISKNVFVLGLVSFF